MTAIVTLPVSRPQPTSLTTPTSLSKELDILFLALDDKRLFQDPKIEAIQLQYDGRIFPKYEGRKYLQAKDELITDFTGPLPALRNLLKELHTIRISKRCFMESPNALKELLLRYDELLKIQDHNSNYRFQHDSQAVEITTMCHFRKGQLAFYVPGETSVFNEYILGLSAKRQTVDLAI
jgi:hypothetical protein